VDPTYEVIDPLEANMAKGVWSTDTKVFLFESPEGVQINFEDDTEDQLVPDASVSTEVERLGLTHVTYRGSSALRIYILAAKMQVSRSPFFLCLWGNRIMPHNKHSASELDEQVIFDVEAFAKGEI
jgi:hypothetical protein